MKAGVLLYAVNEHPVYSVEVCYHKSDPPCEIIDY
jgi:hypothetical protein